MGGPVTRDAAEDTQATQISVNTRAVELALPQARVILPNVPENHLRNIVEAAQQGNQRTFEERLRRADPNANATRAYQAMNELLAFCTNATRHAIDLGNATGARDQRRIEEETTEMRRLRETAESRGYAGMEVGIARLTSRAQEEYFDRNGTPQEQRQTGRQDLMAALAAAGYSVGTLTTVFGERAENQEAASGQSQSLSFQNSVRDAAVIGSERIRASMRDIQDRLNNTTDASRREALELEYQQLLSSYSRLVGGAMGKMADRFARGEETAQTNDGTRTITVNEKQMLEMARAQADLHMMQHTGRLGEYVLTRVRQT